MLVRHDRRGDRLAIQTLGIRALADAIVGPRQRSHAIRARPQRRLRLRRQHLRQVGDGEVGVAEGIHLARDAEPRLDFGLRRQVTQCVRARSSSDR